MGCLDAEPRYWLHHVVGGGHDVVEVVWAGGGGCDIGGGLWVSGSVRVGVLSWSSLMLLPWSGRKPCFLWVGLEF